MYKEMKRIDITGLRFGKLTVLRQDGKSSRNPWKHTTWLCKCDCGNTVVVRQGNLRSGNTQSCGCLKENLRGSYSPNKNRLYNSWRAMKARCNNPNNNRFYAYGARGISVCKEWESFAGFQKWAIANGYADNLTIDRIDCNGNYCPENCRWIEPKKQSKNRRCVKND